MKTPALFVTGTDRVELIEANIPDLALARSSSNPCTRRSAPAQNSGAWPAAARKDLSLHTRLFHGRANHSSGI